MKSPLKFLIYALLMVSTIVGCKCPFCSDDDKADVSSISFKSVGNHLRYINPSGVTFATDNVASISKQAVPNISNNTMAYSSYSLTCAYQVYNSSTKALTYSYNIYLKNKTTNSTVLTLASGSDVSISAIDCTALTYGSTYQKISELDNGNYQIVFQIVGGSTSTYDITITD